jgi:hypothetical protein
MYEAMSTISWSYWAAGAGAAKASPFSACTMAAGVVEKQRADVCLDVEGKREVADLAWCWADLEV